MEHDDWNEQLEIKGDLRDDERDGFEHLETADEIAEYETWLDQGDFEDDWRHLDPDSL